MKSRLDNKIQNAKQNLIFSCPLWLWTKLYFLILVLWWPNVFSFKPWQLTRQLISMSWDNCSGANTVVNLRYQSFFNDILWKMYHIWNPAYFPECFTKLDGSEGERTRNMKSTKQPLLMVVFFFSCFYRRDGHVLWYPWHPQISWWKVI